MLAACLPYLPSADEAEAPLYAAMAYKIVNEVGVHAAMGHTCSCLVEAELPSGNRLQS